MRVTKIDKQINRLSNQIDKYKLAHARLVIQKRNEKMEEQVGKHYVQDAYYFKVIGVSKTGYHKVISVHYINQHDGEYGISIRTLDITYNWLKLCTKKEFDKVLSRVTTVLNKATKKVY